MRSLFFCYTKNSIKSFIAFKATGAKILDHVAQV